MTAGEVRTRYFLDMGEGEVEVNKAAYVAAERYAGLINMLGQPDEPAAHSFGQFKDGKLISGRLQDVDPLQDLTELKLRQGAAPRASRLHDREGQLRDLLSYCRKRADGNSSGEVYPEEIYDELATKLAAILDEGDQ